MSKTQAGGTFTKLLAAVCLAVGLNAQATTYYMRADGSAANKAAAIGPTSDPTACMNTTVHNAQTFSAGDIILLSDLGGNYTTNLVVPSSGTLGNPITYKNAPSESPVVSVSTGPWISSTKSHWTIDGINLIATAERAINIGSGVSAGISISNCTFASSTYGVTFNGPTTNAVISNCVGSNTNNFTFYFLGATNGAISIYDCSTTNGKGIYILNSPSVLVSNVTHTSGTQHALRLENVTTGTVVNSTNKSNTGSLASFYCLSTTNITFTGCNSATCPIGFQIDGGGGHTLNNCSSSGSVGSGFFITTNISTVLTNCVSANDRGNAFYLLSDTNHSLWNCGVTNAGLKGYDVLNGTGHVFNNCYTTNSTNEGFWAEASAFNLRYTNCAAINGHSDGFGVNDYAWDVVWCRCKSIGNGAISSISSGDGFTAHLTNHTIKVTYCLSISNTCSGFAMVGNSQGTIENCTVVGNALNYVSQGGVDQIRGGGYFSIVGMSPTNGLSWTVTNCVFSQNYPQELCFNIGANVLNFDYNLLWPTISSNCVSLNNNASKVDFATYHATHEPHSISADPLFTGTAPTNYSTSVSSPVKDAGAFTGQRVDILLNPVPRGLATDIGAYEIQANSQSTDVSFFKGIVADNSLRVYNDVSANTATIGQVIVTGTTNQVFFGATNTPPASSAAPTKWISIKVNGDSGTYRLPLYE